METFLKDLKHSLRMFRQSPGFTATAVAALALGIGTNTAIFSVVNAVLLRPSPFPAPDRIVVMQNTSPQGNGTAASPAKFAHWRQQSDILEDVAAFRGGTTTLTTTDTAEQLRTNQVSADYFRLFGAPVIRGRTFSAAEDLPQGPKVALIAEGLWQRRFGGDPGIIGRTIQLAGEPHVVIGVVSSRFDFRDFGQPPQVWTPFQLDPNTTDQGHYFTVAGRLKTGASVPQANARMRIAADEYRRKFPQALQANQSFAVETIREALVSNVRPSLLILAGAVTFVLLIACANVANLLLARAVGRRREIAIRAAIGAGRGRIIRQLLTESVLLSLAGGLAGAVLGVVGIRALLTVNTANLPRVGEAGSMVVVDWRVLLFTLAVALGTGLLFGLVPALQTSKPDLASTLKESSSRAGTGMRQNKLRTLLVTGEIALALVLLVGAALLIRTSLALATVNPGFAPEGVLTLRMPLTGPQFQTSAGIERLVREGIERVEAVPGVLHASATCCVPLEGGYGLPLVVMGRPLTDGPFHGGGGWANIGPGYFDVFQIPVVRGRAFTRNDTKGSTPVAIINQAMVKQLWPKSDPLADKILIGKGIMKELADETPRQIVGVVGDVRSSGLNQDPQPMMYVPNGQVPDGLNALNVRLIPMAWIVRTRGNPMALSSAIQQQLRQVSGLPVSDIRTMEEVVSRSTSRQRFNMLLMTIFGGVALLLAAIGIYGLMAYSVQQRTQEIGIRLALGAGTTDVSRMVVWQGMRLAVIGVAIGLAAAFGLMKLIGSLLFGVKERDPMVFTTAAVLLALVSLVAIWLPARRATRVDPVIALRCE